MTKQEPPLLAEGTTTYFQGVGQNEPALLKILRAVVLANPEKLDEPLLNGADHGEFLDFIADKNEKSRLYLDVPVKSIIATQHKNFDTNGSTWRDALAGLTGENKKHEKWDDRALAYIESEIGEQIFPCDNPGSILDMESWGGAVFCANGAHRLIAAVCWLAAKNGEAAMLRKVCVTHYRLNKKILGIMADAARRGKSISTARCGSGWLVRINGGFMPKYWFIENGSDTPRHVRLSSLDELCGGRKFPGESVNDNWFPFYSFPESLALLLAEDSWVERQRVQPRYEARPSISGE